jgi:hypothetical protein
MGPTIGGSFISRQLAAPITDATTQSILVAVLMEPLADGTPASFSAVGNFGGSGAFAFGDLAGNSGMAANWAIEAANGHSYSSVPVIGNVTTLLVARLDFMAGNDRMRLWVNPSFDQSLPLCDALFGIASPADVEASASVTSFAGVFFQNTNSTAARIDEINICVRPIPGPGTGMALLTAIGLVRRRRGACT